MEMNDLIKDTGVPNINDTSIEPKVLREYSRALARLARYTNAKAAAMDYRLGGSITLAQNSELECERIYNTLPPDWRW
jgi:hypothetical protein